MMIYLYKNMWPVVIKIIRGIFECWGGLGAVKGILAFFKLTIPDKFIIALLLVGILRSIIINWPKSRYVFNIKNKDIKLTLKIGDILKEKGTIIIPTNSTFDTKMDNEFISIRSVQGQFQEKNFKKNIGTLDSLIEKELENRPFEELKDRKYSKNKKYEIGTTVEINVNGRRFYFLADSDVNSKGKVTNPSMENVKDALSRLWQYVGDFGHVESIAIPIIGTGRMGIVDSREKIIKQIARSFVEGNKTKKLATELVIYVRKEDIKKYKININGILDYMQYLCKYYDEM